MGFMQKLVESGTDSKYVPNGKTCDICGKKLGFFATGFWSCNSAQYADCVLCKHCDEKIQLLLSYAPSWVKKERRNESPYYGYSTVTRFSMALSDLKLLIDSADAFGKEVLAPYGEGFTSVFRHKESCFIAPNAIEVGVKRSKLLQNKAVVFGFVQLGQFSKDTPIKILARDRIIESKVLEAYVFDCPENTLDKELKAHMGKQRISQWQKGWLVLDTEEKITPSYIIIG